MSSSSYRSCGRCTSRKLGGDGSRCTRRTCKYGPMCWQHTRIRLGVYVKRSTIPGAGLGLFAARRLEPGHSLVYGGKRSTAKSYHRRFPGNVTFPYAVTYGDGEWVVDACQTNDPVSRYANDAVGGRRHSRLRRGRRQRYNAELDDGGREPAIVITRPVRPGQEIFVDYGDEYWGGGAPDARMRARHRAWCTDRRLRQNW